MAIDEFDKLIVIDDVDKTSEVHRYEVLEHKINIYFLKSPTRSYPYAHKRVAIYGDPVPIDLNSQSLFYSGLPINKVQRAISFDKWIKVKFEAGNTAIFAAERVNIVPSEHVAAHTVNPMSYWEDISQYTKIADEEEAFLKKQFSQLGTVHPESILAEYLKKIPLSESGELPAQIIYPFNFNISQKAALERALTNKISVIEGPPGTGKTQTILNIIANLTFMQNKSVAVVSGNNAAVQNVRDKLQKDGYGFLVASMGSTANRNAFFANLPQPMVEGWNCETSEELLSKNIAELTEKLNQLLEFVNRRAELDQQIAAYRLEQKHFQLHCHQDELELMERLFTKNMTAERIISFLAEEYYTGDRLFRFVRKAKLLFKYGFRDFKKLRKDRLQLIAHLQMKYYELKLKELQSEKEEINKNLEKAAFSKLLEEHTSTSLLLFKKKLYERYKELPSYTGDSRSYSKKMEEFMHHFPVLLSTTHSLRACIPNDFLFDYVIVDEASQVDLLTGTLAMSCCKRIIIVGDMKQLPQIVDKGIKNKLERADVDEAFDYFNHSLLSSVIAMYPEQLPLTVLREHYRCKPSIIGFCNSQYYNNELVPMTSEEESDVPLRIHYTPAGNHMREVTSGAEKGKFNQREIEAIKEELLQELEINDVPLHEVGYATPYRLQVKEAVKRINQQGLEIDTVHRYQGREKQIMILSTVLDQSRYGQMGKNFVENPNLVNVAVSRAQKQFILVTDYALFRNSRKDIGNLIRYIEYNTFHEHITQSQLISVFDLLYKEYSEKLIELNKRLINKSKYKSENIIWLVLNDLMQEELFRCFTFSIHVHMKDIIRYNDQLSEAEVKYMENRAEFYFVVYDAINKQPVLAIEVDGFASHRNNPVQLKRDELKESICNKSGLKLLRLPTTGSNEIVKIRNELNRIISD